MTCPSCKSENTHVVVERPKSLRKVEREEGETLAKSETVLKCDDCEYIGEAY